MKSLRWAGVSLIITSLGFIAIFSYLAARFGYPEVLDGSAARVLPTLVAGGAELRAVWLVYALLPSGLAFSAWAARPALEVAGKRLAASSFGAAIATAVTMTLGLARWPTLNHALGERFVIASPAEQQRLAKLFDTGNLLLGRLIGEQLGELALSVWFALLGLTLLRGLGPRWLGYVALGTAASMLLGSLRNLTSSVAPIAAFNNTLLPVFLIALGATFALSRRRVDAPLREDPRP